MTTEKKQNTEQQAKDKEFAKAMLSSNKVEAQNGFNQIYKRYKSPIFFLVLRMVKMNTDIADDLVQEIFVKVYEKISKYDNTTALSTWLYAIANNHVIDYKRRENIEVLSIENLNVKMNDGDDNVNDTGFQLEDFSVDLFETSVRNERAIAVLEALDKGVKCEQSKQIITLIFLDDMSYEKVAEQMQLPLGTVKNMMFRAKKEMKNYLAVTKRDFHYGKVLEKKKEWKTAEEVYN